MSFSASRGTLSGTTATTDAQGEARVTLTTNGDTDISVAAGTKTATTKITGVPGPAVALTCSVGSATNCATASVGQAVVFTAQRAQGSGNITSAVLDFGDNSSVNLGKLSGPATIPHTYTQPGTYTARLTGTDGNESSSSVQVVLVTAVTATVSATITTPPRTVTATATVSAPVTQYVWSWGDMTANTTTTTATAPDTYTAAGTFDITVTATLQGGGTATATTSIVVPITGLPGKTVRIEHATSDRGYAMAALLVAMAVIAIVLSTTLPVFSTVAKRERETELIFRGQQYARAVTLFQRKYRQRASAYLDVCSTSGFSGSNSRTRSPTKTFNSLDRAARARSRGHGGTGAGWARGRAAGWRSSNRAAATQQQTQMSARGVQVESRYSRLRRREACSAS